MPVKAEDFDHVIMTVSRNCGKIVCESENGGNKMIV